MKHLFEKVRAHQPFQDFLLVDLELGPFDALRNPSPPLGLGEVHEFHANIAAVDAARFLGCLASQLQIGELLRLENAQRVQRRLVISPPAKNVKNTFALFVIRGNFL